MTHLAVPEVLGLFLLAALPLRSGVGLALWTSPRTAVSLPTRLALAQATTLYPGAVVAMITPMDSLGATSEVMDIASNVVSCFILNSRFSKASV